MKLDAIDDLQFLSIPQDLVESTCASEFTEDPEFSIDFLESTNAALSDVIDEIKKYRERDCEQNCWGILREKKISEKRVQVWLFYIFLEGSKSTSSFEQQHRALLAARFHFILLKEPGSSGCQFFHSIIYEKSMNILKIVADHNISIKQKKSNKKGLTQSSQFDEEDINDDDDVTELLTNQVVLLLGELTEAVRDFCFLLKIFSLKDQPDSIKQSILDLVHVVKCFGEINTSFHLNRNIENYVTAEQLTYRALRLFINKKHGNIKKLSELLFRLLMTTITMKHASASTTTIPKTYYRRSEAAMKIVESVVEEYGNEVNLPCRNLLQNIVAQCPDRMEFKQHVGVVVSQFLYKMSDQFHANYVNWLRVLSYQTRGSYRVGALAVMGHLLGEKEREVVEGNSELDNDQKKWLTHKFLLENVNDCLNDAAPKVRAKALSVLSEYIGPNFSNQRADLQPTLRINLDQVEIIRPLGNIPNNPNHFPSMQLPNSDANYGNTLFTKLSERCKENKLNVRKIALQTMENAVLNGFISPTISCLNIFKERCRDPLLSVRKLALQSVTSILTKYPENIEIHKVWVECLFPSIKDPETSMQEKGAQLIEEKILQGIVGKKTEENLAWNLLGILTTEKGDKMRLFLDEVTKQWNSDRKLKINFVKKVIQNLDKEDRKDQAWMFLRMLTLHISDPNIARTILTSYQAQSQSQTSMITKIDMVCCIGQVAAYLEPDTKEIVISNLQGEIEGHKCDIQLIGKIFEAVEKIKLVKGESEKQAREQLSPWYINLLISIDQSMYETIMSPLVHCDYELLVNQLYVVGELAQRCPQKVPKRLLLSLQSLLTNPKDSETGSEEDISGLPLSQFHSRETPSFIRAHAIFNLGRVCFHNEMLAKKCVPAMARELEVSPCEIVRNNVLIVLTDLCVIQTQLVDLHLNDMATCLGDQSIIVRKQSIILLSSLLRKGYIKWKGTLLLKFLHATCDVNTEIKALARSALLNNLLKGQGIAGGHFFRSFISCVFYFNLYEGRDTITRTKREKKLFDISGDSGFPRRNEMYKFMLDNMEDEHRINLTQKLCSDVLDAMVEGQIPLNKKTEHILSDCLAVLCCKEIRLKCLKSKDGETDFEEEMSTQMERQNIVKNKIKQKIISGVVKQNLVENVIPIIIAVKTMLVEQKSHLVRNVMLYLKEVMQEYKKEVQVILSEDKQLASEIEFDLKRFHRIEEEKELQAQGNIETPIIINLNPQTNRILSSRSVRKSMPHADFGNQSLNSPHLDKTFSNTSRRQTIAGGLILKRNKENPGIQVVTPATIRRRTRMSVAGVALSPLNRATSTPTAMNPNITFAAKDISVISKPPTENRKRQTFLPVVFQTPEG